MEVNEVNPKPKNPFDKEDKDEEAEEESKSHKIPVARVFDEIFERLDKIDDKIKGMEDKRGNRISIGDGLDIMSDSISLKELSETASNLLQKQSVKQVLGIKKNLKLAEKFSSMTG